MGSFKLFSIVSDFILSPHRGNLLKTPDNKLGLIDFGSVVDIDEDFRYSLFGLVIGLQIKDLALVTENLLKLGFLKDTKQLDQIVPRLTKALKVDPEAERYLKLAQLVD